MRGDLTPAARRREPVLGEPLPRDDHRVSRIQGGDEQLVLGRCGVELLQDLGVQGLRGAREVVRRVREVVWIAIGLVVFAVMRPRQPIGGLGGSGAGPAGVS